MATGSRGNFILLDRWLALDIGVSYKAVEQFVPGLKAVFVSHEHGDHLCKSTVKRLAMERPGIMWLCGPFLVKKLSDLGCRRITIIAPDRSTNLGLARVRPVRLHHDVPNYGLCVSMADGWRCLYATDTGSMEGIKEPNYDLYLIEGNHGEEEIAERIRAKMDAGEYAYEIRAREQHLSKEKAMAWLVENAGPESRYIFIHQHTEG